MTEREQAFDLIVNKFLEEAEKDRGSRAPGRIVNSQHMFAAAIMVAGWGASISTISNAVTELHKKANGNKNKFVSSDYLSLAVRMAQQGAYPGVVERLLASVIKDHCWIWALEGLTALLGRKPKREEVFALVEAEVADLASFSQAQHDELVSFADQYLTPHEAQKVREMLKWKFNRLSSSAD